jgi:hypothetical protein
MDLDKNPKYWIKAILEKPNLLLAITCLASWWAIEDSNL